MRPLLVLVLIASCDKPVQSDSSKHMAPKPQPVDTKVAGPIDDKKAPAPMPVTHDKKVGEPTVTARARKSGNTLALDVTFTNRLAETVHVYEKNVTMARGLYKRVERPTVLRTSDAGVASVVLGRTSPDAIEVRVVPLPTYQALERGKSVSFSFKLAWPLVSFHPMGETRPLDKVDKLQLSVEYMTGTPAWRDMKTAPGEPVIKSPETHTPILDVTTTIRIEESP